MLFLSTDIQEKRVPPSKFLTFVSLFFPLPKCRVTFISNKQPFFPSSQRFLHQRGESPSHPIEGRSSLLPAPFRRRRSFLDSLSLLFFSGNDRVPFIRSSGDRFFPSQLKAGAPLSKKLRMIPFSPSPQSLPKLLLSESVLLNIEEPISPARTSISP